MMDEIKICGIRTPEALEATVAAGATHVGLVFFEKSPRHVSLEEAAALAERARGRIAIVALTIDADDPALSAIATAVRPDIFQLHGRETPARVRDVHAAFGRPVWKALGVATREDLKPVADYEAAGARLLFDAKPPPGSNRPGGNAHGFDWSVLAGLDVRAPFMLSGGLTVETVGAAIAQTRPGGVDVSSGVERTVGEKDPALIRAFVAAARAGFDMTKRRASA